MKIKLTEIPEEGRDYHWSNLTGEINGVLADIVGKNSYDANFFIRPLNSKDFELVGTIQSHTPDVCSRCGADINVKVSEKYHEILIPKLGSPRNGKYSKVNHVSDLPTGGPETSEYENMVFDMGEYLHEVVALAAPFNPTCKNDDSKVSTESCFSNEDQLFSYDEAMPEEKPESPFAALKNLKLN